VSQTADARADVHDATAVAADIEGEVAGQAHRGEVSLVAGHLVAGKGAGVPMFQTESDLVGGEAAVAAPQKLFGLGVTLPLNSGYSAHEGILPPLPHLSTSYSSVIVD
jgi:hypothetical protein